MKSLYKLQGMLLLYLAFTLIMAGGVRAEPFTINGKPVPDVVASVNGVKLKAEVLISEIKVYRVMNQQNNRRLTGKELEEYSHQALSRLVDQELIYQEAHKQNIRVAPETVNRRLKEIRGQFPSEEMFQTALDLQGLTVSLLKSKLEKQMTEEQYIRQVVAPTIKVEDREIQDFYRKNQDHFKIPERYEAHHIFTAALKFDPDAQKFESDAARNKAERLNAMVDQDALEKIKDLYRQLKEGADFAQLAEEHSEDSVTGKKGGAWGPVMLDELPAVMADTLRKLKQNEFSEPVRSQYGYHILKWTKIIPAGHQPLAEIKTDIMNALLKEKTLREHEKRVSKMRAQADIKIYYK